MTCLVLFQEEPPQDMVRIVNDSFIHSKIYIAPAEPLISCHCQVLKRWMISREVLAMPKPSDQPFQPTSVCRGGVYPPRGRCIQEGSDGVTGQNGTDKMSWTKW